MGYIAEMFSSIASLGVPPAARVMDIGSQAVRLRARHDVEQVNDFIGNYNPSGLLAMEKFAEIMEAKEVMTFGSGFDILYFSAVNGVVQFNQLAGTTTGSAGNGMLMDVIEQIAGANFDDVLSGGRGINVLDGNGGNDLLVFLAGEANGDLTADFAGNGAGAGDS